MSENDDGLETPKQFASRHGISVGQVRGMIQRGQLEYVRIGSRILIPHSAWVRFLELNTVKPCHDETKVPASVGSTSASATTSPGLSAVGAASAALARQTANKLKSFSLNGYKEEAVAPAQVIPLQRS